MVLADALAEAIHTIGRVGPLSGDPYRMASQLGMPPWRVQKAQKQARNWSRDTVATAMKVVAALNANVKGRWRTPTTPWNPRSGRSPS